MILNDLALQGKDIILRTLRASYFPQLGRILNDEASMASLHHYFGVKHWTDEMVAKRYERFLDERAAGRGLTFAVFRSDSGELVGDCGFKNIDSAKREAEYGIILHRAAWGTGIVDQCFVLCLKHGFEQLGLETIYCVTSAHNERAKAFLSRAGIPVTRRLDNGDLRYDVARGGLTAIVNKLAKGDT